MFPKLEIPLTRLKGDVEGSEAYNEWRSRNIRSSDLIFSLSQRRYADVFGGASKVAQIDCTSLDHHAVHQLGLTRPIGELAQMLVELRIELVERDDRRSRFVRRVAKRDINPSAADQGDL